MRILTGIIFSVAAIALAACAPAGDDAGNGRAEIVYEAASAYFDGVEADLLTGGLGIAGLTAPQPPAGASLRTIAIHTNFRSIVDVSENGGFTRLYGPAREKLKIAGTEYLALARLSGQTHPFAIAVQIPDDFDRDAPCLIVGPASGSRGVYGAVGTAGLWGLTHRCAVALTDKTTGTGFVHLDTNERYGAELALIAADSDSPALFSVPDTLAIKKFASAFPHRVAVKHAHSRENIEKDWGEAVLAAAEYGVVVLRKHFDDPGLDSDSLQIIAASVSNGGNAVVRAAELDQAGFLDGVVASEPNLAPPAGVNPRVEFAAVPVENAGRPLYDYATYMTLYAPCATLAASVATYPGAALTVFSAAANAQWCGWLKAEGLLDGDGAPALAANALQKIRAYGFGPDTDKLLHYGVAIKLWPSIAVVYGNAYGRFGVEDRLCGVSYAYTDAAGAPRPATLEEKATLAALSPGVAPTAGISFVYDDADPRAAFDAALCFRDLWEGSSENAVRVREGVNRVRATAALGDTPVIILHGRADALIPVSHSSRAYAAVLLSRDGANENFRYYEIEGGQHFDAFLALPDVAPHFTPMDYYFDRALELMRAHLSEGAALPPSQVIRNTPRGDGAPPLSAAHLGGVKTEPGDAAIVFADGALGVPE